MDDNDEVQVGIVTPLYFTGGEGAIREVGFNLDRYTRNLLVSVSVLEDGRVEFEIHLDQVDDPDAQPLSILQAFLVGLLDVLNEANPA